MYKEEFRKNIEFAKARQMVLFPLLLALVTMVSTIGLQFLVGDSAAQTSETSVNSFTWQELRFGLHLPLLMFSLGMGTFAFMGRDALVRRTASKNHLLASPALQPLPNSMAHFAYFVKDLVFYVMLILSPIILGMGLGKGLDTLFGITTPLEYSSLPWTWFAMVVTLAQGLVLSFLASALWMRGRPFTIFGPLSVILFGIIVGVGAIDIEFILIGLQIQTEKNVLIGLIGFVSCIGLGYFSSMLIIDDFDVSVVEKGDLFRPMYGRLSFLGRGEIRIIVAKEFVDLFTSKNEGDNSPADLFITVDVGKLWQGGDMGLFQKFDNESVFENIDSQLLDNNSYWVPVTYRSRVIVYSNERVKKEELSTYEDLSNEKWKGRLLVRSSSNAYNQALTYAKKETGTMRANGFS